MTVNYVKPDYDYTKRYNKQRDKNLRDVKMPKSWVDSLTRKPRGLDMILR